VEQQAGYYPDPVMPGYLCYWDGHQWLTGSRTPAGHAPMPVETTAEEPRPAPPPEEPTAILDAPVAPRAAAPTSATPDSTPAARGVHVASRRSRRGVVAGAALLVAGGLCAWATSTSGSTSRPLVPRTSLPRAPEGSASPAVASPAARPTPSASATLPPQRRSAPRHVRHRYPAYRSDGDVDVNRLVGQGIDTGLTICHQLGYC